MNQTRLRERCDNFIERANISVSKFCNLIDVSREFYYSWHDMEYDASRKTTRKIDDFLGSDEAKRMLEAASGYKSAVDCGKIVGLSTDQIRKLCRNGLVEAKRTAGKRWMVKVESLENYLLKNRPKVKQSDNGLSVFGGLYSEFDVNWKPILSRNNDHEIFDSDRYEMDYQYWIGDNGIIYNGSTGHISMGDIDADRYVTVSLIKGGKRITEYVHRLVAYHFCPNRCYKDEVHHIDGKCGNNHSSNLIWTTKKEHQKCHELMKKNKREYRKYIKQLRKSNQWLGGH